MDPILAILQSYGGRQGVGFSLQRLAEIASMGLGRAEQGYRDLPAQISALYAQPRQDVLSSIGSQFQDTADRQARLQSQLNQQFGRSGLGSLRGTQTAALEQQAQRQNLATRDALARQLAGVGLARAGSMGNAYAMLPQFLERRTAVEQGIADRKTQHIVARKEQKAQKNNALFGALGSLGGAALGSMGLGGLSGMMPFLANTFSPSPSPQTANQANAMWSYPNLFLPSGF